MKKIFGLLVLLSTIVHARQPLTIEQKYIDAYKVKLHKEAKIREYAEDYGPYVLLAAGAGYIGAKKIVPSFSSSEDFYSYQMLTEETGQNILSHLGTNAQIKSSLKGVAFSFVFSTGLTLFAAPRVTSFVRKWLFWKGDVTWFLEYRTSLPKIIGMLTEDTARLQNESVHIAGDIAVIATATESMFKQIEYLIAYIEFAFDVAEKKSGKKRVEDQFSIAHTLYTAADSVAQALVKVQVEDANVFEYAKLNQAIVTLEEELKYTVRRAQQAIDALKWLK